MLCMPPRAAAGTARLGDRAGGDQARGHDHIEPSSRTVLDREMNPLLTLAARGDIEIAGFARREQVNRLRYHHDRTGCGFGSGRGWGFRLGSRDRRPDQHQATNKARGQPGPDQAKVSPEHRANTFLDGAVTEGSG